MGAQSILNMVRKIIYTKKPFQLSQQLSKLESRHGPIWKISKTPRITITSSSFLEKGVKMWNLLDNDVKNIQDGTKFKAECKKWTLKNIPIKPG